LGNNRSISLAHNLLTAIEKMQTSSGAVLYATSGTCPNQSGYVELQWSFKGYSEYSIKRYDLDYKMLKQEFKLRNDDLRYGDTERENDLKIMRDRQNLWEGHRYRYELYGRGNIKPLAIIPSFRIPDRAREVDHLDPNYKNPQAISEDGKFTLNFSGSVKVDYHEVSLENNFSLLSGLRSFLEILRVHKNEVFAITSDIRNGSQLIVDVNSDIQRLESIIAKMLNFFRTYGLHTGKGDEGNKEDWYFYQGGVAEKMLPDGSVVTWKAFDNNFAADCQTWGMTILGQPTIDGWFGEGSAYQIWQNTKRIAGHYVQGKLWGIGFSNDDTSVLSSEWTFGAINMCLVLAEQYRKAGRSDMADALSADAESMYQGVQSLLVNIKDSRFSQAQKGYLYSNKRYFIPFGWYANPIPNNASTSWGLLMHPDFRYNPFYLGGKMDSYDWGGILKNF
ncbi:MAG: hypothetical protein HQK53_18455, partial [Oligoflexia bacterium]|nr:hypothetical protein [Oligoflexia bacterium]